MWKNININIQNVEKETDKALLIKMPNNSEYKGYCFWHPAKLVRKGKHRNSLSISYTDDFTFKLKKFGNGKFNKYDVIKEVEIDAEEFENTFGIMNDNIQAPKEGIVEVYHHIPEVKEVKEVEVAEELRYE